MTAYPMLTRRVFLADLGRGAAAIAVLGVAACVPSGASTAPSSIARVSASPSASGSGSGSGGRSSPAPSTAAPSGSPPPDEGGFEWHRVNLGFVSAYLLVRDGEAAVVDTGVGGSEGAIEDALTAGGLGWEAVGHVIVTHKHGDHAGSIEAVLERAASATGYAGAADLPAIQSSRTLTAVDDGDDVFGLGIVGTPGHTPGHVSVYDAAGGIFVAGDALGTNAGAVTPPGAQFTEDMALARTTIAKIGALTFETLLVGHGDPIESGASQLVAELAAAG